MTAYTTDDPGSLLAAQRKIERTRRGRIRPNELRSNNGPIIRPMLESRRVAGAALLILPAGLTAYFAFNSGGFYAGSTAYVAITEAHIENYTGMYLKHDERGALTFNARLSPRIDGPGASLLRAGTIT